MKYRYLIPNIGISLNQSALEYHLIEKKTLDKQYLSSVAIRLNISGLKTKTEYNGYYTRILSDELLAKLEPTILVKVDNKWKELNKIIPESADNEIIKTLIEENIPDIAAYVITRLKYEYNYNIEIISTFKKGKY